MTIDSGSVWEPIAGSRRAVRVGDRILVSGMTATHGAGTVICPGDVGAQTTYILDKIVASVEALGGRADDIVRTRIADREQLPKAIAARYVELTLQSLGPTDSTLAAELRDLPR